MCGVSLFGQLNWLLPEFAQLMHKFYVQDCIHGNMSDEKDYVTISLPKETVNEIKEIIKKHPELGYSSVDEFVNGSVRDAIKEIRRFEKRTKMKKGDI